MPINTSRKTGKVIFSLQKKFIFLPFQFKSPTKFFLLTSYLHIPLLYLPFLYPYLHTSFLHLHIPFVYLPNYIQHPLNAENASRKTGQAIKSSIFKR
jgi:hypothetical protein